MVRKRTIWNFCLKTYLLNIKMSFLFYYKLFKLEREWLWMIPRRRFRWRLSQWRRTCRLALRRSSWCRSSCYPSSYSCFCSCSTCSNSSSLILQLPVRNWRGEYCWSCQEFGRRNDCILLRKSPAWGHSVRIPHHLNQ